LNVVELEHVNQRAHRAGGSGVAVEGAGTGFSRVALWGELPLGWAGRLAAGLARHGLDTRTAMAMRSSEHGWLAEFEVAHRPRVDLGEIDYLRLCQEERDMVVEDLALERFTLKRLIEAGTLELTVVARDRLGFLALLLGQLAFFSLFPEAMRITTVDQLAHDSLWLRGLNDRPPGAAIEAALVQSLSRSVRPSSRPVPRSR
jgi:hypothetical protein